MSRFALLVLVLSFSNNEVACVAFGRIFKFQERLTPRASDLSTDSSALNSTLSSVKEIPLNSTEGKIDQTGNSTLRRGGKFFIPKFEILAGLNLSGGLSSSTSANSGNLAKTSEPSNQSSSGVLNPFIAASYDPYAYITSSYAVQQSIADLTRLLQLIKTQLENSPFLRNDSSPTIDRVRDKLIHDEENEVDIVDDRRRRKDKVKTKNKASKMRVEFDAQEENDEDEAYEDSAIEPIRQKPSKTVNRQATVSPNATTAQTESNATNGTQLPNKGYYGGQPQPIGDLHITYDLPRENYGPPFHVPGSSILPWAYPSQSSGSHWETYGPPSQYYGAAQQIPGSAGQSYNPPSQSYGPPSPSYGPPSLPYGPPSPSYVPSQIPASDLQTPVQFRQLAPSSNHVHDPPSHFNPSSNPHGLSYHPYNPYSAYAEAVLNDVSAGNSFRSSRSWPSNISLGRSKSLSATTEISTNANGGFVPN